MAYINTRAKQSQGGEWGKLADADFARFRIVCEGSDADHVKYPAAVTDVPFGITLDGCEAAEDAVALAMLGRGETQIVKVSEEVDKGDPLCPAVDGSGEARLVPATPGAYWLIGEALEDGAEDQEIAVDDRRPKLVGAWDADSRQFSVTTIDINGGSIDGATIGAAAAGAITGTTITGTTITDGTVSRTGGTVTGTWADLGSVTTIDINGGSIDGATIGAAAAGAITGTTITGTTLTDGTISTTAGAVTGALNISGATVTYRAIAAADLASALQDAVPYAAITGVDNTDGTGSVTIQVRDAAGNALAGRFLLRVWVSTAAYGAPAAITGFAVTTGTQAQEVVANADRWVITDANGVVVMSLSDAATHHVMAHGAGGVLGYISQAVTGP
ncbi:MAG: hypothetical protein WC977_03950 [Anaerovoracaceae bacterium]